MSAGLSYVGFYLLLPTRDLGVLDRLSVVLVLGLGFWCCAYRCMNFTWPAWLDCDLKAMVTDT